MRFFTRKIENNRSRKIVSMMGLGLLGIVMVAGFSHFSKPSVGPKSMSTFLPNKGNNTTIQTNSQNALAAQMTEDKDSKVSNIKIEKIWQDGSISMKVGEDVVTVTAEGDVLYLPQKL